MQHQKLMRRMEAISLEHNVQVLTFSSKSKVLKFRSKLKKVSKQATQESGVDIPAWVGEARVRMQKAGGGVSPEFPPIHSWAPSPQWPMPRGQTVVAS